MIGQVRVGGKLVNGVRDGVSARGRTPKENEWRRWERRGESGERMRERERELSKTKPQEEK